MAHKVLSKDMAELVSALKLAEKYSTTTLDNEYRKYELPFATSSHLLYAQCYKDSRLLYTRISQFLSSQTIQLISILFASVTVFDTSWRREIRVGFSFEAHPTAN